MNNFTKELIADIKTELMDEFDKNFTRKAFFDKKWEDAKLKNNKGSLMMRTGKLRRSLKAKISGTEIVFSSSVPYASLHNEGGTVTVTHKMKRFFWAMYYKTAGAVAQTKKGEASKSKRSVRLNEEAAQWKALALQKVGKKMHITQRQFIGDHPQIKKSIERVMQEHLKALEKQISDKLKQK